MRMAKRLVSNIEVLSSIIWILFVMPSCKKDVKTICNVTDQSLHDSYDFPIGVAVDIQQLYTTLDYSSILQSQFNSLTAENVMKFDVIHPFQNTYNWNEADLLIDFAIEHDKNVHGHTLIWDKQLPGWILNYEGSKAEWEQIFKNHIQNVVLRYKSKIQSWDVVNEAFDEKGNLKDNIWTQNIGEDYIEKAFNYAHEADPEAKLFYNDFNLAMNSRKKNGVLELYKGLKEKNIPIHGIGFQMHINIHTPIYAEIKKNLNCFAEEDLLVRISELDISINPLGRDIDSPSERKLKAQAEKVMDVFKAYCTLPIGLQHGITFWGVSDKDSWIPDYFDRIDYPLIFDSDYQPKPSYCSLLTD